MKSFLLVFLLSAVLHPIATSAKTDKDINAYFFGHSLVYHMLYKEPIPKELTSLPFWITDLANTAGHRFTSDGQFGFLRQHAQFPPKAQWRFDNAPSGWGGSFKQSQYTDVILTAANFIQYQAPDAGYYDDPNVSALSASLEILDFVLQEAPNAKFYIYENWADMGPIIKPFPPANSNVPTVKKYYDYQSNKFHDWWLTYQDQMRAARPNANIKLIPVGPIFSPLFTQAPLNQIPFSALYEDKSPHGTPTLYFLASLIHYMVLFQEQPPENYTFRSHIHPLVVKHYKDVNRQIWDSMVKLNNKRPYRRIW